MSKDLTSIKEIIFTVAELYEKFQQNLSGNKNYKFIVNDSRFEQLLKFSTYLSENVEVVTTGVIKQYLTFAFGKYSGRKGHFGGKNQFTMNWIISVKLLQEYVKSDGKIKWVNQQKLTNQNKIKRVIKTRKQNKRDFEDKKSMMFNLSPFEESEKNKFLNTQKGFYWCIDFTTLYNPFSVNCKKCKFVERCTNLLKQNYPNVYKTRIEHE